MKRNLIIYCSLVFLAVSCKKDTPPVRPDATGAITTGKRLIICNEGGFGHSDASISVYDPNSGLTVHDAYGSNNNNQVIGDVLQSVGYFNEKYYWMVNNSFKIVITDKNFVVQTTVGGFVSPRYISFVSNNKAYVTNIKTNSVPALNYVQVLDLNTNTITKNIRIDGWTEELVQSYGKVFVTNQRKNYVYVIDAATDMLTDSIFLNAQSACMVKDENEKIWVSCNANATLGTNARLVRIDPVTNTIEADINLGTATNSISRLTVNGAGNTLYFLMTDMYRMPISSTSAPAAFIQQGARKFYGVCVDPQDETIYVADAVDYQQDGTIVRYQHDGTLHSSFKVGIIPGFMRME